MNQKGFAEFLGPVWQFGSFFEHHSGSFQNRTTGYHIFPFTGVMNMFSAFFVKKNFAYQYLDLKCGV